MLRSVYYSGLSVGTLFVVYDGFEMGLALYSISIVIITMFLVKVAK